MKNLFRYPHLEHGLRNADGLRPPSIRLQEPDELPGVLRGGRRVQHAGEEGPPTTARCRTGSC